MAVTSCVKIPRNVQLYAGLISILVIGMSFALTANQIQIERDHGSATGD